MSWLRGLLLLVVAVFASAATAWYWVLHTNPGAVWIVEQAESLTDRALSTGAIDGDLASGLSIDNVGYSSNDLAVATAVAVLVVDVDLLPFSVEIVSARIEKAHMSVSESADSQAPSRDVSETLRKLQLPFPLHVSDLVVSGLAIELPTFEHTISLLELTGEWHDSIAVERLRVDGEGVYIEGAGSFDLASDLVHIGDVSVRLDPAATGHFESIEIDVHSEGDADRSGLHVAVGDFAVEAHGEIRHAFEQPVWDIDVSVPHYLWPLEDDEEAVEFRDLIVRSTGSLDAWSVDAAGGVHAPGMQWLSVEVAGEGNKEGFTVKALRAQGADLDASGTARIAWMQDLNLETSLTIARADPRFLVSNWPGGYPVQGTFNAMLDASRILIDNSRLTEPRTGAELRLDADINPENGSVQGALQWKNLRWPLDGDNGDDGDTFDVKSDQADVQVDGTLDAWSVAGTIQVGARDLPEGSFRIDGSGNRDAARVRILEATMLGGTVDGEFEYSWRGERPWQGQFNVATIETGSFFPDWPGQVSGRVSGDGQIGPLAISAELTGVNGTLRGDALEASGGVRFTEEKFVVNEFSATHGASMFKADGGLDESNGLAFEITIADAGDYVAGMTGDVKTTGVLRLTQDQPLLSLNLDAGEFGYGGVVIGGLQVNDVHKQGQIAGMQLTAEDVQVGAREFGAITALLEATMDRQSLAVEGTYRDSKLSLSLEGALADWSAPLSAGWHGVLGALEVTPNNQHLARLLSPAEIFVSSERVQLREACIGPNADETICASVNWAASGAYDVAARFNSVPVNLLNLLTDTDLVFDQIIDGEARWVVDPAMGPSGYGRLSMTPGRISSIDRPQLTLATGEGVLNFRIADNKLLNGTFGLPLPGNGEIKGSFRLHDLEQIEDSAVSGGIVANVTEIAILSPLIPAIDRVSGRLQVDVSLTGSVGAPLFRGNLTVNNGSAAFDPLGLSLEDLNLTARMTENYRVDLNGEFRSGDGHGTVTASADYRDFEEPYLSIGFEGERLALLNVEDVRAVANPDFDVTVTSEVLSINGSIHIPEALVTPVSMVVPQVYESPDVVIVAGELPDLPEPDPVDGLQYSGSLDISLGDDVIVDLDVARASVEGTVTFDWRGDSIPYANGRYYIVGTVSAFGQVLDISSGSIRFPDVPADSPIIRVRAEREIYGNTQVKRAGLLVDGPLTRPNVDAYTQPATTEERALALLVTGSDFDFEQGVGAIDFGTYISPRVFVSYGIGVFERDNIVSARFDLTRALGIKASSGEKESGVDLNYRFEN